MEEADLVILNTCHIREKAAEKVYSELGRLRQTEERARGARAATTKVVVAGCVAQAEGEEIIRRAPAVDLVVGPQTYHRLPELIAARCRGGRASSTPTSRSRTSSTICPRARRRPRRHRLPDVQEGCDKFCTFCVVPYTRGAEVSRPVAEIVAEAERLADAGVREITLSARTSTPITATGRTGAAWPLGAPARAPGRDPGPRAPALHHLPSARHGRRPDRGPSRGAGADAVPAPAGAVGLGPHPRRR